MPKVKHSVQIRSDSPYRRIAVVDPPNRFKGQTRVVESTCTSVRQLRGKTVEIHTVQRVAKPNLSAALPTALDSSFGGRELHKELREKSRREIQERILDPDWLPKVDLKQVTKAFPPELRDHSYLIKYHLRALHITGLIDNLGPDTEFDPIGYLESTFPGRAYLTSIVSDCILEQVAKKIGYPAILQTLIGRIWIHQSERVREGLAHNTHHKFTTVCWQCFAHKRPGCLSCQPVQTEVEPLIGIPLFDGDEFSVEAEANTFKEELKADQQLSLFPEDPDHWIAPDPEPTVAVSPDHIQS